MYRLLFSLLMVFLLVGCTDESEQGSGEGNESESGGKSDSTLNVAYMAQPPFLDPHVTNTVANRDIGRNIFESLLSFDADNNVAPLLAESFEESEDGKSITFHLRQGIKFHNGEEMTADDVVASMERWRKLSAKANSYLADSEFVKEDDETVVLHMDKPMTIVKYILAMNNNFAAIMPKEIIEQAEDTGVTEFIGTGPFKFVEWKQDQYIELAKNEDYQSASETADGLVGKRDPLVDQVFFHFIQDSSTRTAGIQTGDYDIALAVPSDNVPQLETDPNLELHIKYGGPTTVIFNKKKGLFADQQARQAVNLAINKKDVLMSAFPGDEFHIMEHGLLGEDFPGWHNDAGKEVYENFDPEEARKMLADSGYDGETVRILTTRDYEDQYFAAVVVQQQLEDIGVNVDLQVYDWPSLMAKINDENAYEMFIMAYAQASDPTEIYYLNSRDNYPGWSDSAEIDALLDELMIAPSDEEAKEIFTQLQAETWEYLPAVKFGDYNRVTVTYGDLKGFDFFYGPIVWNVEKP